MSDVVLNANDVAQVVTYVAPGFMARLGYRSRYPGPGLTVTRRATDHGTFERL